MMTPNHETPRTDAVNKQCRKEEGNDYWPWKMRDHAVQLERELIEMTRRYIETENKLNQRIEANEAAMKTCASLAAENDRMRGDLEAALNSYHAANNERLTLNGITAETKHPNAPADLPRTGDAEQSKALPIEAQRE